MDKQAARPEPDAVDSPPAFYETRQPPQPAYTIYLLTVWFDSPNNSGNAADPASWRFRLENPRTKEAHGFVGVASLVHGLTTMMIEESKR